MYYVLRIYTSGILPSVLFQTKDASDASIYAALMDRANPGYKHIVVKGE